MRGRFEGAGEEEEERKGEGEGVREREGGISKERAEVPNGKGEDE